MDGWPAFSGIGSLYESDDQLRARVFYVGGDGDAAIARISRASGARLDEIAENLGLKRRKL